MESEKTKESYRFINNKECRYFPCHKTDDPDSFNCLFCYCPLYALGDRCEGAFRYIRRGERLIKDCSACMIPHRPENYAYITGRYDEILALALENHEPGTREEPPKKDPR